MKSEKNVKKSIGRHRQRDGLRMWSKLQVRMTMSYVLVSVATALLLELLLILFFFLVIARLPYVDQATMDTAQRTAQTYALEAAVQANGTALNPDSTFQPGQPSSLVFPGEDPTEMVPYTTTSSSPPATATFALLITPGGQVLASSYPALYPVSSSIARLLPGKVQLVRSALAGKAGSLPEIIGQSHIVSYAQPVLDKQKHPIGAVYVQLPEPGPFSGSIFGFVAFWFATALFWLILTAPVGAVFGMLTTRKLVRRLHRLVKATSQFAQGDYTQRVAFTRQDEIGQLERQFNAMAEQLVESIAREKVLTEQHARLEERARIEQELRTAQYIQRALLPKEVPALPGWQLVPFYRPAREVGGDFYDFLPAEDGRLVIVIGDATDKGVSAALLMATTCTMLRTVTQQTASPGEVLARVNDLLASTIPAGVFVTCFYAILDLGSGRLCYANAGHDLPYLRHEGQVSELRATGMPLGLMPGWQYEEKETTLAFGDNLLLYSDGLVEAHNPQRDMFSFPYLSTLLQEDRAGEDLLDFLLSKLATFTGPDWEQEDDVTLLTLQRSQGGENEEPTPYRP